MLCWDEVTTRTSFDVCACIRLAESRIHACMHTGYVFDRFLLGGN